MRKSHLKVSQFLEGALLVVSVAKLLNLIFRDKRIPTDPKK